MWKIGKQIGDKEGRMDACVAAAGILKSNIDCLEYPAEEFRKVCIGLKLSLLSIRCVMYDIDAFKHLQVIDVNVNGVLFTAQAAGRQMERFGNGGSIVLIASMSGSITNQVFTHYYTFLHTADI